ncbi:hypothetical protein GJ744_007949 [Endocarpon pusillum]|uniref:Uncharacterized protein n=1 Tax=Endocarpon pusillum TaxID=364733 RepID=A0A8H7AK05_9EURO|nr:hypothetical protein GJ744_007949 [Endocarpon pusillum]
MFVLDELAHQIFAPSLSKTKASTSFSCRYFSHQRRLCPLQRPLYTTVFVVAPPYAGAGSPEFSKPEFSAWKRLLMRCMPEDNNNIEKH